MVVELLVLLRRPKAPPQLGPRRLAPHIDRRVDRDGDVFDPASGAGPTVVPLAGTSELSDQFLDDYCCGQAPGQLAAGDGNNDDETAWRAI